jgi:cobalamin biosynthesis Mg chelatase CobN
MNAPYNGPLPLAVLIAAVAVVVLIGWLYWRSRR